MNNEDQDYEDYSHLVPGATYKHPLAEEEIFKFKFIDAKSGSAVFERISGTMNWYERHDSLIGFSNIKGGHYPNILLQSNES